MSLAVTSIAPSTGLLTGGTTVLIEGTGFTGASAVYFGATAAASYTVNSDTQVTAVSPAGTGTVDVTVTVGSPSATSAVDQFTYFTTVGYQRPDSRLGDPVTGTIGDANNSVSAHIVIKATDHRIVVSGRTRRRDGYGDVGPRYLKDPAVAQHLTLSGKLRSGVLMGITQNSDGSIGNGVGNAGESIVITCVNNHTLTGTMVITAWHGSWMRWSFIGRMFKHLVPSFGIVTISGWFIGSTQGTQPLEAIA
jgi:hypothetical protein